MRSKIASGKGDKAFQALNYVLLTAVSLTCLLPMLHVLALSFSDTAAAASNSV